jgi:modulator of FtsH protease
MAEASEWESFYVMSGGAAAVLTGLVFVGVTLHTRSIMAEVVHRNRGVVEPGGPPVPAAHLMAVLAPDQSLRLLCVEIDALAAFWLIHSVRITVALREAFQRSEDVIRSRPIEWLAWVVWVAVLGLAGVALLAENLLGFSLLAFAMAVMFGSAVWSAWVLIAEISV